MMYYFQNRDVMSQDLFAEANNSNNNHVHRNRVINLFSDINPEVCNEIIERVLIWEEEDNEILYRHSLMAKQVDDPKTLLKPIIININSYGGSVYDLFGLVDALKSLKAPIITRAYGKICSAAFILFCIGDERYVGPNCTLMYHSLRGMCKGTPGIIDNRISHDKLMQKHLDKLAIEKTGLTMKLLKEWKDTNLDKYLTPKEAIELNIATGYLY